MAAHSINLVHGVNTYVPHHPMTYGECGWWGRELTLEQQAAVGDGHELDGIEVRDYGMRRYLVVSECAFVGPIDGLPAELIETFPIEIETSPPDGE